MEVSHTATVEIVYDRCADPVELEVSARYWLSDDGEYELREVEELRDSYPPTAPWHLATEAKSYALLAWVELERRGLERDEIDALLREAYESAYEQAAGI